jgi:hypothetical protein
MYRFAERPSAEPTGSWAGAERLVPWRVFGLCERGCARVRSGLWCSVRVGGVNRRSSQRSHNSWALREAKRTPAWPASAPRSRNQSVRRASALRTGSAAELHRFLRDGRAVLSCELDELRALLRRQPAPEVVERERRSDRGGAEFGQTRHARMVADTAGFRSRRCRGRCSPAKGRSAPGRPWTEDGRPAGRG